MQFFEVRTPEDVLSELRQWATPVQLEHVPFNEALGRVVAEDIHAPESLPPFTRAIMDGYAVRAADTFGATASLPAYLDVVGEVGMGEQATVEVGVGQAVQVATGSMLPEGADAVVMVEYTGLPDTDLLEIQRSVAPWENTVRKGEDVEEGALLLSRGRDLRPQDIGGLAALGIECVPVFCKVRVEVVSTGDELVPPEQTPGPGQIRDINSYSLAGLIHEAGAEPHTYGLVEDVADALHQTVTEALRQADVVLISGGSSVGTRDITLDVIESIPGAHVFVHGVSIRPGKPVIGATVGHRIVFGLPGNPVSVMVVFDRIVAPVLAWLSGCTQPESARQVTARLTTNYASDAGREDHVRVRLFEQDSVLMAEPVLGKSALIMTMVRADGVFVIPTGVEGIEAGDSVQVRLF